MEEIEFKFLIEEIPNTFKNEVIYIKQSYLDKNSLNLINEMDINYNEIDVIRIRSSCINNKATYTLTLKTKGLITRNEFEKEISKEYYQKLEKYQVSYLEKNRYINKVCNFIFEFDEFLNFNLFILEVEVDSISYYQEVINILEKLNIKYIDVSNNYKYTNMYLAKVKV